MTRAEATARAALRAFREALAAVPFRLENLTINVGPVSVGVVRREPQPEHADASTKEPER